MSVTDREIEAELETGGTDGSLVEYLGDRAGSNLRCVVAYDETGWDALYARDDLHRDELSLVLDEAKTQVRRTASEESPIETKRRTVVSCYDGRTVVLLPFADRRSVAVLLDADATPQIRSFVAACREYAVQ